MQDPDIPGDKFPENEGPENEGPNNEGPNNEPPTFLELAGTMMESIGATERMRGSIDAVQVREIERARLLFEGMQAATPEELAATRSVRFESTMLSRRSFEMELALTLRIPERTAQTRIGVAKLLCNDLTATISALETGSITYRHAEIIVNQASGLDDESMLRFEKVVLPIAETQTVTRFKQAARILRERLNPESIEERNLAAGEDRETTIQPASDGMAYFSIYGNALDVVGAQSRISHIVEYLRTLDGETRTRAQLRADVALELLLDGDIYPPIPCSGCVDCGSDAVPESAPGSAPTPLTAKTPQEPAEQPVTSSTRTGRYSRFRPTVYVTVPVLAMLGNTDTEQATLDGIGPIPMDQALDLAANAPSFIRLLTHPETGVVLSVGRDRYKPPADLATYIRLRDKNCRSGNCSRPADQCDIDHNLAYSELGATSADNLACECPPHHTTKHAKLTDGTRASDGRLMTTGNAWSVAHELDEHGRSTGTLIWTSPTGRRYRSDPAVPIAPPPLPMPPPPGIEAYLPPKFPTDNPDAFENQPFPRYDSD